MSSDAAKAVVRRNTEKVQGCGNFDVFEELFAGDFMDHTTRPNCTPDKAGAMGLYYALRTAFSDFHADIQWQAADAELVNTFKTYYGTSRRLFRSAPTDRSIHFETVDVMRVHEDQRALGCGRSLFSPPADSAHGRRERKNDRFANNLAAEFGPASDDQSKEPQD